MNGTNSHHIIQGNGRVSCNPSEDLTDRPEVWSRCSYLPAATKLGQGNVFTGVCDSVHRGGGCLPECMLGYPPGADSPRPDTPPGADPPSRHPHWEQTAPWTRHPPRSRPPWEQTHTPQTRHPRTRHPPDQAPPRKQMPAYGQ